MKAEKSLTKRAAQDIVRRAPAKRRASVLCGLVGHSRMVTYCFGYLNCARCGAQVGDTLMGLPPEGKVVEGHGAYTGTGCDCAETAAKLTWRDTMLVRESPEEWLATGQRRAS